MRQQRLIIILLGLITAVILFHVAVMGKILPYDIAWGGRLKNDAAMYVFEAISITINLFLAAILLMKDGFIHQKLKPKTIDAILWLFFGLFVLNTTGNLFAQTIFEKYFAGLTLLFALLILLVLRPQKTKHV